MSPSNGENSLSKKEKRQKVMQFSKMFCEIFPTNKGINLSKKSE